MSTRANSSRERILSCAEAIILEKGFTGTSIDDILEKASITKGGFFYHFEGKGGLAQALIERYLEQDEAIFKGLFDKANDLSEDPLHQLLIFLKLLADMMGELEETHPGCLVASFTYENQQFNEDIRDLIKTGLQSWRNMIVTRLTDICNKYPIQSDVSLDDLADMFISSIEGGVILSRAFGENRLLVNQILAYRSTLRTLFGAN